MPATTEQLTKYEKIEAFVKGFKLSGAAYKRVMSLLHQEMINGLRKQTHTLADIKMFPTFVRSLPDGTERGEFLALDLGGTNFRVLLVRLQGIDIDIQSKTYLIPQRIMLGTGTQLFDHIADCIGKFVTEHNLTNHCLPLGFTFSFPCQQEGLAKARLSKWTKGFRCEGVVGEDICQLLQEALKRRTTLLPYVTATYALDLLPYVTATYALDLLPYVTATYALDLLPYVTATYALDLLPYVTATYALDLLPYVTATYALDPVTLCWKKGSYLQYKISGRILKKKERDMGYKEKNCYNSSKRIWLWTEKSKKELLEIEAHEREKREREKKEKKEQKKEKQRKNY
ncbi:Hexokinase type 2 [Bulinus truncatus]|nr:Hexokinase type 2 [Bulinus truncatus]